VHSFIEGASGKIGKSKKSSEIKDYLNRLDNL